MKRDSSKLAKQRRGANQSCTTHHPLVSDSYSPSCTTSDMYILVDLQCVHCWSGLDFAIEERNLFTFHQRLRGDDCIHIILGDHFQQRPRFHDLWMSQWICLVRLRHPECTRRQCGWIESDVTRSWSQRLDRVLIRDRRSLGDTDGGLEEKMISNTQKGKSADSTNAVSERLHLSTPRGLSVTRLTNESMGVNKSDEEGTFTGIKSYLLDSLMSCCIFVALRPVELTLE